MRNQLETLQVRHLTQQVRESIRETTGEESIRDTTGETPDTTGEGIN